MSSAILTTDVTAPVALATAPTAAAAVEAMVLAVRAPASRPITAGSAVAAAPAVATVAMMKAIATPMSMRRSASEKWPVGSVLSIGLVENAWFWLKTLAGTAAEAYLGRVVAAGREEQQTRRGVGHRAERVPAAYR
jgi:hypothetical protein